MKKVATEEKSVSDSGRGSDIAIIADLHSESLAGNIKKTGNVRKELKCVIMTVKTGDKYGNSRGQVSRMRTDESA